MSTFSFGDVLAASKDTGSLDAGPYRLEFLKGQTGTTKAGAASYGIQWRVADGPDKGRRVWDNYYASENNISFSILNANLVALGVTEEEMKNGISNDDVNNKLAGVVANVDIDVKHGTKGGVFTTFRVTNVDSQLSETDDVTGNDGFPFGN